MYPQLISALAAERRRDMIADANAHRLVTRRAAHRRAPHLTVPRFRVSWSRTTLAAAGRGRGRSYVIVISATRTL